MNQKVLKFTTYTGIFLVVSGISYFVFSQFISKKSGGLVSVTPETTETTSETGVIQFQGPKTEVCPLNGTLHTAEEKEIWSARRPLLVMIENHEDSRPQSGLQAADIVYEAIAEGGITRFMGVYYCDILQQPTTNKYDLGPVRSARTYFMDFASEYSDYPLYTHVGGGNCSAPLDPVTGKQAGPCTTNIKAQAIEQIAQYGWNNEGTWSDLSQFSLSYKVCRREPERTGQERATEHTMYCSSTELWNTAANRGLTNKTTSTGNSWDKTFKTWSFNQADKASDSPLASVISFDFWSGYKQYSVKWTFDKANNNYVRTNGGVSHIDFNTGKALTAKNIIVEYAKESRSIDEHLHNLYEVIGTGKGILYQNGNKQEITWSKASRIARTIYKDASGQEINFVPGNIWIEILPINTVISYEGN